MPLVPLRPYWLNLKNSAFDPRLCWDTPPPSTARAPGGWNWVGISRDFLANPHTSASRRGDNARPSKGEGTHLWEGPVGEDHHQRGLPAAPVPHQDHLDRAPAQRRLLSRSLGRLHPGLAGGQPCAERRVVRGGLAAAGAGLARRDRNVEGAGRREEVGAGRPGQEAARGAGDTQLR